jgi:hypothetical protein
MAAIYPEITIEWGEETYSTKADFEIICKIEQKVNLAAVRNKTLIDGVPCLSSLAIIYANLLRSVGVSVLDSDVYEAMYGANDGAGMDQHEIITACAEVFVALTPRNAPVKKKTRTTRKKK